MKHLSILVPSEQSNMSTYACIIGALQVFNEANNYQIKRHKKALFKIELIAATKKNVLYDNFLSIKQHASIQDRAKSDLILIPASLIRSYDTATKNNKLMIDWIKEQYKQGSEIASMCAGSFMLASTGILTGKKCSTHWALAKQFSDLHPEVHLQTDQLITDEYGIYTNGGAYSFLQLLMYLVEKKYDREAAIHCAKYFQIDLDRNLQSGFAIFNGHKKHNDEVVLEAQAYIEKYYRDKISIEKLATDLNTGRRNFDRRFIKATGFTPLDYLQRVKIEAAKKQLESSRKSVNEIMYEVGYNDTKAFREVFMRITGMTPLAYKSKYNKNQF